MKQTLTEENFISVYNDLSALYKRFTEVCRHDCAETQQILVKLTECGMWFRMYKDLEINPKLGLNVRRVEKRAEAEKENPN